MLIDGGQGQLNAARETLAALGVTDVPMIGVAKGPERDAGNETFFCRPQPPVKLPPRDPVLYFIQRLRDEAHRFAIGSHRTRRKKDIREAGLQEIPGIGPDAQARAVAPLRHAQGDRARVARRSGAGAGHQRGDRAQDLRFLPRDGKPDRPPSGRHRDYAVEWRRR